MADTLVAHYTATVTPGTASPVSFSTPTPALLTGIWVVIPARRGSRGCPGKALRSFRGKTLLEWAVRAAEALVPPNRIVVTTDYEPQDLPPAVLPYWHRRPDDLCLDDVPMADVLRWASMRKLMPPTDHVILLQPSSWHPDRAAIARLVVEQDAALTGARYPDRWHPYYAIEVTHGLPHARQGLPEVHRPDGLVYYVRVDMLDEVEPFIGPVVPVEGTHVIDTEDDWRELVRAYGHPQDRDVC